MVDYNSERFREFENVILNHIVELNKDSTYFCAGRDYTNGRIHLFLYFKNRRKLYVRRGHRWQPIENNVIFSKISEFISDEDSPNKIFQFFKNNFGIKR